MVLVCRVFCCLFSVVAVVIVFVCHKVVGGVKCS